MQDLLVTVWKPLVAAWGILFPDQRLNPSLLHWESGVLATGPPGKSLSLDDPLSGEGPRAPRAQRAVTSSSLAISSFPAFCRLLPSVLGTAWDLAHFLRSFRGPLRTPSSLGVTYKEQKEPLGI